MKKLFAKWFKRECKHRFEIEDVFNLRGDAKCHYCKRLLTELKKEKGL